MFTAKSAQITSFFLASFRSVQSYYYILLLYMSRPAVPTSVINKFVIANVRWRVDAEFELHRRHDERTGAGAPGIYLVVNARERHTRASSRILL